MYVKTCPKKCARFHINIRIVLLYHTPPIASETFNSQTYASTIRHCFNTVERQQWIGQTERYITQTLPDVWGRSPMITVTHTKVKASNKLQESRHAAFEKGTFTHTYTHTPQSGKQEISSFNLLPPDVIQSEGIPLPRWDMVSTARLPRMRWEGRGGGMNRRGGEK